MASYVVRTGKLLDRDLIELFSELFETYSSGSITISLPAGVRRQISSLDELRDYKPGDTERAISAVDFRLGGNKKEQVSFRRGTVVETYWAEHQNAAGFNKRTPSAYFDEIALLEAGSGGEPLTEDDVLFIIAQLNRFEINFDARSDDDARELSSIVGGQIDQLRRLHLEMVKGVTKSRNDAEREFVRRQTELEKSFSQRVAQLDERESELERRRSELNDREPQHERRRLREHLTSRLQATIAEPRKQTARTERIFNLMYLVVAAVFVSISVLLAISTDVSGATGSAAFWARSAKSLVSGVAGAAFAWAGLSGLKASAVAAREYEQAIQRYAFDMDRASWIVETILQMNTTEETSVPDEWLESVCRDLFVSETSKNGHSEPLQALAALFEATAKARIGTSGVEFEIDRKGARRLADQ